MSIRTTVVRMAVAAVAVAGVLAAVWAQASPITTAPSADVLATVGKKPTDGTMLLSYTVESIAKMEVKNENLSGDALASYDAKTAGTAGGNAGTIKITTNYPNWDVEMRTNNGGVLRIPGKTEWEPGEALTKNKTGGGLDTAILHIQFGVQRNNGQPVMITHVDSGWVRGSVNTSIAFSKVLGVSGNSALTGLDDVLGGRKIFDGDTDNEAVSNNGFAVPNTADNAVTFFVNAGLGLTPATKLNGNVDGKYTETLTFSMVASY